MATLPSMRCAPRSVQSSPVCAACCKPLCMEIDDSGDLDANDTAMVGGESSSAPAARRRTIIPDDARLHCGCHFHWQCLLDSLPNLPAPPETCPHCSSTCLRSNAPLSFDSGTSTAWPPPAFHATRFPCDLHNEGGIQHDLNILPLLLEEQYLRAYPHARRARALLEFCRQGDLEAVLEMLAGDIEGVESDEDADEDDNDDDNNDGNDHDDNDDEDMTEAEEHDDEPLDVLRYQDPLGEGQSALHITLEGGYTDIVWALLWRGSTLEEQAFPPGLRVQAQTLGLRREEDIEAKVDIRSLRDGQGRRGEDVARQLGGVWLDWIHTGRLSV